MTPVLYSFSQADDHQMCWGAWEQSSWASVWRQLSYDVAVIGRDADPPTHTQFYTVRQKNNTNTLIIFAITLSNLTIFS